MLITRVATQSWRRRCTGEGQRLQIDSGGKTKGPRRGAREKGPYRTIQGTGASKPAVRIHLLLLASIKDQRPKVRTGAPREQNFETYLLNHLEAGGNEVEDRRA